MKESNGTIISADERARMNSLTSEERRELHAAELELRDAIQACCDTVSGFGPVFGNADQAVEIVKAMIANRRKVIYQSTDSESQVLNR